MATSEPPALLQALKGRIVWGVRSNISNFTISTPPAAMTTNLKYEHMHVIKPFRFLAAYSTAAGGTVSRIVARIEGPATDPRANTQYIVTEYGVAHLRGKSSPERAVTLIAPAHPKFRDELSQRAGGVWLPVSGKE